ncbi:Hypothetical protein A7982_11253 [Minicystis rosea]|nr:Hypothetical protein A7982_11253 [Minicystis rosea]
MLPPPTSQENQRVFGLGTALGGGVFTAGFVGLGGTVKSAGALPYILLPSLEFKYFLQPQDFSIDVSIPVTNMIIGSAASGGFYFGADAFFNFNLGKGSVRGVLGPGLGFEVYAAGGSAAGAVRIPAEIGFEALTSGRHFGFSLMARPWFELIPAGGASVIGGGAMLALGFMGYYTK